MTKKQRRQMRIVLSLSVMIASVPLSLAFLVNEGHKLPTLKILENRQATETENETEATGKVLPMLATK